MAEEMNKDETVLEVKDSQVTEDSVQPGQDTHIEDLNVVTKMIMDAKDLLPGLSREDFMKFLDELLFKAAVYDLKYRVPQIIVDGTVEETTMEKIENLLGHAGYVASLNSIDQKYSVNVHLGEDIVVIRDRIKATALIRAVLTRYTRNVYKRIDLESTFVNLWLKLNNLTTDKDPRRLTKEDVKKQAENLLKEGIDVNKIEKELIEDKDQVQEKQDLNYQAMQNFKA